MEVNVMSKNAVRIEKIDDLSSFPFEDEKTRVSSMYENYLAEYGQAAGSLDAAYIASRIGAGTSGGGAGSVSAVCTFEGGKPGLFVIHSPNDFDSSVLGKKCARIELFERAARLSREKTEAHVEALSRKFAADGYGMVTARVRGADFVLCDSLVRSGFVSVDELDIFWMRRGSGDASASVSAGTSSGARAPGKKTKGAIALADITPAMRGAVEKLSGDSFLKSRYYNDPSVRKEDADRFYARLASAFLDNSDGVRIAALHDGRLAGFIIGVENEFISGAIGKKFIYLYLIAVDSGHQGLGVGETLVRAFTERCFGEGYEIIEVGTQSFNFRAAALYERCGYRKCEYLRTFHLHVR